VLVQSCVVDRHSRGRRQGHEHGLVFRVELLGALLLGEVQVAEDLVADPDRRAEEALHRRVVAGEAERVGVGADVADPSGPRVADQQPEHPVSPRRVSDRASLGVGDAARDELDEMLAVRRKHAQRAISGVDHVAGRGDDPRQHLGELEVGADGHDAIEQSGQSRLRLACSRRPSPQLGQQVLEVESTHARQGRRAGPLPGHRIHGPIVGGR